MRSRHRRTPASRARAAGRSTLGAPPPRPAPGSPFTFALIADSHIEPRDPVPPGKTVIDDGFGTMESTLLAVTAEVRAANPDFVINLGDMLDYHLFGFNAPPPDASWARLAYLNYRRLLGDTVGHAAHFPVIGNWDGESGCNTPDEIARSTSQRLLYAPGPGPATYPEGGSANGDYYAFTWGDALFVVLNVMTYTPTCHLLSDRSWRPGRLDARRRAARVARPHSGQRDFEMALLVHPPHRRRRGGRSGGHGVRSWWGTGCLRRRAGDHPRYDVAVRRADLLLRPRPRLHGHGGRRDSLPLAGERGRAMEVRLVPDRLHALLVGLGLRARLGGARIAPRSTSSRSTATCSKGSVFRSRADGTVHAPGRHARRGVRRPLGERPRLRAPARRRHGGRRQRRRQRWQRWQRRIDRRGRQHRLAAARPATAPSPRASRGARRSRPSASSRSRPRCRAPRRPRSTSGSTRRTA